MRTKRVLLTLLLVLLLALPWVSANAAAPVALADGVEVKGALTGNPAGAFSQYELQYPGNDTELEITLSHWPPNPLVGCGIGFRVYGWNGFEGQGVPSGDEQGVIEFSYAAQEPTTFLVQVECYGDDTYGYTLSATGVAAPAVAVAPPAPAAVAAPPAAPQTSGPAPFAEVVSGAMVGDNGGALRFHAVDHPGDGFDTKITLTYSPNDPSIGNAVGFNIYAPSGALVAEGQVTGDAGEREATFSADKAGRYVVQVYNYLEGLQIDYTLEQGHMVDIGGRYLNAVVVGEGSPTVVMEAGLGQPISTWAMVSPEILKMSRVVMYDRAFLGKSDDGPEPRNVGQVAEELHALLTKMKIAPPYVLVGHSMGGMTIRMFAARWPGEVAGLVFVDGSHEDLNAKVNALMTPEEREKDANDTAAMLASLPKGVQLEFAVWGQNEAMMRNIKFPTNVPVVSLVQNGPLPETAAKIEKLMRPIWLELHADWLKLMPQAKQVLANKSGHMIQFDEPNLVIQAVRDVLAAVRQ